MESRLGFGDLTNYSKAQMSSKIDSSRQITKEDKSFIYGKLATDCKVPPAEVTGCRTIKGNLIHK